MIVKSFVLGSALLLAVTAMGQGVPQASAPNNQEIQVGQSTADIFKTASGADIERTRDGD